jgi:hypothetical protein
LINSLTAPLVVLRLFIVYRIHHQHGSFS